MSLYGQYAWVIGGAGTIGRGLCRGLLRAGATVLVNSRNTDRLAALSEELGHPDRLIALHGSMLPGSSEKLTHEVMEMTSGQLDHVVAHSGVQWWDKAGDETSTLSSASRVLTMSTEEFASAAVQLPLLHFEAARLLMPRLQGDGAGRPRSYTLVTGGTGGVSGVKGLAQINAQALWGLSAALQQEVAGVTVAEVRCEMQVDRTPDERSRSPRSSPLSHDLGSVVAGIAANPVGAAAGLHAMTSVEDVAALKARFPAQDDDYPQQEQEAVAAA